MTGLMKFWREFEKRAEAIETASPLDPMSRPAYAIASAALGIEIIFLWASDFTLRSIFVLRIFCLLIFVLGCAWLSRRYGHPKLACALEAVALPTVVGGLTVAATVFLSSVSTPFADEILLAADRALGLDWLNLFALYQRYPELYSISGWAYHSMLIQLPVISLALFFFASRERGWSFLTAWTVCNLLTALIYPFFTAQGPYLYFGIDRSAVPMTSNLPWTTGPLVEEIRSGNLRELNRAMRGMVFLPSFHTAAGVMYIWAMHPFKRARPLVITLNVAMISATVVYGYHYFIDLIGGGLVAIVSILAAKALVRKFGDLRFSKCSNDDRSLAANAG